MTLYRNDKNKELIPNGSTRHGQWKWHNADCQMEDYGISLSGGIPHRALWCATHGQWAIETPIKVAFIFEDGTEIVKK